MRFISPVSLNFMAKSTDNKVISCDHNISTSILNTKQEFLLNLDLILNIFI